MATAELPVPDYVAAPKRDQTLGRALVVVALVGGVLAGTVYAKGLLNLADTLEITHKGRLIHWGATGLVLGLTVSLHNPTRSTASFTRPVLTLFHQGSKITTNEDAGATLPQVTRLAPLATTTLPEIQLPVAFISLLPVLATAYHELWLNKGSMDLELRVVTNIEAGPIRKLYDETHTITITA